MRGFLHSNLQIPHFYSYILIFPPEPHFRSQEVRKYNFFMHLLIRLAFTVCYLLDLRKSSLTSETQASKGGSFVTFLVINSVLKIAFAFLN